MADALGALMSQFATLQAEIKQKQAEHQTLKVQYRERCSVSLEEALKQLYVVIKDVDRFDRKLIDWHARSSGLKTALRLIKVDRGTQAIVDKRSNKLKTKVAVAECKFGEAGQVYDESTKNVTALHADIKDLSISSVQSTSMEAQRLNSRYDEERESMKALIEIQEEEVKSIRAEEQTARSELQGAQTLRQGAEGRRNLYAATSALSYAGAAAATVASFFFLPVMPAVVALTAAGTSSLSAAKEYGDQARELGKLEKEFDDKMNAVEGRVAALTSQLSSLEQQRSEYVKASQMAQLVQKQALALRNEAHEILTELGQARRSLHSTREAITAIGRALNDGRYATSRREMSDSLCETLELIRTLGSTMGMTLDSKHMMKARLQLRDIQKQTPKVLQIIETSTWSTVSNVAPLQRPSIGYV